VATQAHPELKSRPTRAHPLFAAFVKASVLYAAADELPVGQDVVAADVAANKEAIAAS
jgi:CTP synthase